MIAGTDVAAEVEELNVLDRITAFPFGVAAAIFAASELADLATALQANRELNPLAALLLTQPLLGLAVKLGLIVFVVGVADLLDRRRPSLARLLLAFGTVAALFGAISNTQATPFVS